MRDTIDELYEHVKFIQFVCTQKEHFAEVFKNLYRYRTKSNFIRSPK